jgi:hypothetical protein
MTTLVIALRSLAVFTAIFQRTADALARIPRNPGYLGMGMLLCLAALPSWAATVATPVFSPVAGTYTSAQSVTITSATSGASIRYTTDGSTPTATVGTLYSSAVSITATTTLKAIAYKSGSTNSSVRTGVYTIAVVAPAFSPAAGTYTSAQSVTISSTTSGASIRYTTDGSTPTSTTGTVYSAPVSIAATTTLKAIAYKSGLANSSVTTGVYTIAAVAPAFSPVAGTYTGAQSVTISSTTSGASIRYTTDGSTPTSTTGTVYSAPVSIAATTTLKAIAYKSGLANSAVTTGVYTIAVAAPAFNPVAGTYTGTQSVTITSATSGASIRYTTNGTTPTTTTGTLYSAPVNIAATATLKAIAYKSGLANSAVTSGLYTINLPATAAPVFDRQPGLYSSGLDSGISSATSGASIRYTTDGSTPTSTVGTLYGGAISLSATTTLKAIAYKSGLANSSVTSGTYTISPVTLPFITEFEASQGYVVGSVNGQLGWNATNGIGDATVSTADFSRGARSAQLIPTGDLFDLSTLSMRFASAAGQTIQFGDLFIRPVAGDGTGLESSLVGVGPALISFRLSNGQARLYAYDKRLPNGGDYAPTSFSAPILGNNQTQNWVRVSIRLDFTTQKWDLYSNAQMVTADFPFLSTNLSYLRDFDVVGNVATAVGVDDIYVGPANPLFADVNNNGLDDAWETSYGLSLATNNRALSPSGSGVTVLQAYLAGTNPNDFYNGVTPTLAITDGNNEIGQVGQFNVRALTVSVKNAAGTTALNNAPVIFTVQSGGGQLATTNTGNPVLGTTFNVRTDFTGTAKVYFKQPSTPSTASTIVATAGNAQVSFASLSTGTDAPNLIGGLRLFLKTDAGVTTDGLGQMTMWRDQSGLGNNASSNRPLPTLITNAMNGRPVARFDGTLGSGYSPPGSGYSMGNFMNGATSGEAFVVLKNGASGANGLWNIGGSSSGGTAYPSIANTIRDDFGRTTWPENNVAAGTLTNAHLYNVSSQAGLWENRINGAPLARYTTNVVGFTSSPSIGFGPVGAYTGDIAEIIVYDRVLTAAERDTLGQYLNARWQFAGSTTPSTPGSVAATPAGPARIKISWGSVSGALYYEVERSVNSGAWVQVAAFVTAATYTDEVLPLGSNFQYRVRARNYSGVSPNSAVASASLTLNGDSNQNGILDYIETRLGLNPVSTDSDGDGVSNTTEVGQGTNPLIADTDRDGVPDATDYYPLDASRWLAPVLNPSDLTAPILTLVAPRQATLN